MLFFTSSCCKMVKKWFCHPNSSEDLCLLFYLYPSSMEKCVWIKRLPNVVFPRWAWWCLSCRGSGSWAGAGSSPPPWAAGAPRTNRYKDVSRSFYGVMHKLIIDSPTKHSLPLPTFPLSEKWDKLVELVFKHPLYTVCACAMPKAQKASRRFQFNKIRQGFALSRSYSISLCG